ncbi:MAG: arsenate reductase ArsC [Bdellovibrionales bacterium]|nr:arsenate reductase ArsC [Bdellovibrionales bacterium]
MKNILFLCTGNSCRSQMAEGWAKKLKGEKYSFYSAGTKKHGLNPYAVKVMDEVGVDISSHQSKTVDELPNIHFDYVITVCSDAHETCPYFPGGKIIHKGFDDPPRLTKNLTDENQILFIYRRVRDEIKEFITHIESELRENEI